MYIQLIRVNNFRIFEGFHEYKMHPTNLITGKIGCGKSTLGRVAPTFAYYGYSEVPLTSLRCKWSKEKTWVEVVTKHDGQIVSIKREIPSKVTIKVNGTEVLPEATTPKKNEWIKNRFGDLDYFKKFRMIDLNDGINILDLGKTSLRKTLVNFHEGILNNIRKRLLEQKSVYDKYNKDTAIVYKHYPSEKRLNILNNSDSSIIKKYNELNTNTRIPLINNIQSAMSSLGALEQQIKTEVYKSENARTKPNCPTCNAKLPVEKRKKVVQECLNIIHELKKDVNRLKNISSDTKRANLDVERKMRKLLGDKEKLNKYKMKLQTRMLQKDYKYTNRDILLVNNAVKELDKFYSYYIIESVSQLEPIINSIICKINFKLSFQLSEKGEFDIILNRNGYDYSYKELSSGERLMLSVAFQLSLLLDKGENGLILADEGFNNLDTETISELYEMLKELPFQFITILHRYDGEDNRDINIIKLGGIDGIKK